MIQLCSTVACSAKNVLWGACLKPCIVLDRHVHSEGFTKRSRLDVDLYTAYMANRGWFICIQLPPWIQWACVTHSQPLSGSCLAHHLWIFKWTRVQNCPVSQISPFLCMPQSVPPVLSLLPCVPSSGTPVCRSWWSGVECGEEGGGRPAQKGGNQLFPHRASTPHWSVAHLAIWGLWGPKQRMQSVGIKHVESTRTHTAIELMLHLQHTKWA